MVRILRRLLRDWFSRYPVQLLLPLNCEAHGDTHEYAHGMVWDLTTGMYGQTGFYGRCVRCGMDYNPICDR